MGQKVNPINFRLQVHKNWSSRWFTANKKDFARAIAEDHEIRELIEKKFASRPTINRIEIERSANLVTVTIHTAKAGVVIGRGGAGVISHRLALSCRVPCSCCFVVQFRASGFVIVSGRHLSHGLPALPAVNGGSVLRGIAVSGSDVGCSFLHIRVPDGVVL